MVRMQLRARERERAREQGVGGGGQFLRLILEIKLICFCVCVCVRESGKDRVCRQLLLLLIRTLCVCMCVGARALSRLFFKTFVSNQKVLFLLSRVQHIIHVVLVQLCSFFLCLHRIAFHNDPQGTTFHTTTNTREHPRTLTNLQQKQQPQNVTTQRETCP